MKTLHTFALREDEIHVWSSPLVVSESLLSALRAVLCEEEMDRASRSSSSTLRDRFLAVRGTLRHLLGRYLNRAPDQIRFIYGPHGKPSIASNEELQFSLTHSGDWVAYALARGCPLGIDMERLRALPDMEKVANRMFCADEAAEIRQLPVSEQERAFFCCWTRKEAYAKADGRGLLAGFNSYRVTVRPGDAPRIVHMGFDATLAGNWSLHDLCLSPQYVAALAYPGARRSLSIFQVADLDEILAA